MTIARRYVFLPIIDGGEACAHIYSRHVLPIGTYDPSEEPIVLRAVVCLSNNEDDLKSRGLELRFPWG